MFVVKSKPWFFNFPRYEWDNVWFTSDIHAFHKNLCVGSSRWTDKSGCRNFPDEQVMTKKLIENFNSCIKKEDLLIDLGDHAFGDKAHRDFVRKSLNVKHYYRIFGNHDDHYRHGEYKDLFSQQLDYAEITVNGQLICMSHYPMYHWKDMLKGSIHLFGHVHGSVVGVGKNMDVGVTDDLMPYSAQQILDIMATRTLVTRTEI